LMMKNQGAQPQATSEIKCPTLLLHGTADETMPIDVARLSPGVFKDADLVEFENFKHSMVFSHGTELVEAMFDFLKKRGF
jgi:pimeloyl-ACP methyl ester carboxylesterase